MIDWLKEGKRGIIILYTRPPITKDKNSLREMYIHTWLQADSKYCSDRVLFKRQVPIERKSGEYKIKIN